MKYIITDPCYIIPRDEYEAIGRETGWEFESKEVPFTVDNGKITIHRVRQTPNGDGSYKFRGQLIGVDSGMLCLAEGDPGNDVKQFGAVFDSKMDAMLNFHFIVKQF